MPTFTVPPPAPSRGDPVTFPDRADAFVQWQVNNLHPELVAAASAWGPGVPFCTVGGTANARTLTSGFSIAALVTGQRVVFIAPSSNTGATTINLDGLGAVACRTVTGVALPSGYIRTGVPTYGIYDGTNWVLHRIPERITNANGTAWRYEDGRLACLHNIAGHAGPGTPISSLFMTAELTWTLPANFVSTSLAAAEAEIATTDLIWTRVRIASVSSVAWRMVAAQDLDANTYTTTLWADGAWY